MKIIFNDATEITVQQVEPHGDYLRVLTVGNTPEQLKVLFTDTSRTSKMIVQERGQTIATYEGYTAFYRTEIYTGQIYGVMMYKQETLPEVQSEIQQAANQAAQSANQASQQIQQNAAEGNYSASVSVGTVTTGDPGTQAQIYNSGTAKDAIFNFVIPQGPKGPTGPIGPQGPTGTIENLPTATVEFTEAAEKENLQSGDTVATLFGKIQKYFSDMDSYWPRLNNIEQVDLEDVFSNMSTVNGITFSGKLTVFTFGINHSPYLVKLVNLSLDVTVNNRVIPQITSLGPVSSGYKNLFGNSGIAQAPTIDIVYLDGSGGTEVGARIGFYPYVTDFNGVMYNVDSTSGSNKKYTGTATWIA